MKQIKEFNNSIGIAEILSVLVLSAGFWFYLAILIIPEPAAYGELQLFHQYCRNC